RRPGRRRRRAGEIVSSCRTRGWRKASRIRSRRLHCVSQRHIRRLAVPQRKAVDEVAREVDLFGGTKLGRANDVIQSLFLDLRESGCVARGREQRFVECARAKRASFAEEPTP